MYGRAWMSLTASSAEGWCLTVMEAALCGTPSGALRVGGLPESIVDGETGVLADTPEELSEEGRRGDDRSDALRERARRERGGRARARSHGSARRAEPRHLLERDRRERARVAARRDRPVGDDQGGGLAAAKLGANAHRARCSRSSSRACWAPTATARWPRCVSTFLILMVPGMALQVATARDTVLGRLGGHGGAAATLADWTRRLGDR